MEVLKKLVGQSQKLTSEQIINIISEVGKSGDTIIIKNDGLRTLHNYTVVTTSGNNKFDSIRYDSNELDNDMKQALGEYLLHQA